MEKPIVVADCSFLSYPEIAENDHTWTRLFFS